MARPFAQTLAHGLCVQASSTVATRRASATAAAYENPTCGLRSGGYTGRSAHAQPAMHARSVYSRSFVGGWALLRARARATRLRIGIACLRRALAASANAVVSSGDKSAVLRPIPYQGPGVETGGRHRRARLNAAEATAVFVGGRRISQAGAALAAPPPALLYS